MDKKILTIISFLRIAPETIDASIKLAKEKNAELVVMFVIDNEYADKVSTTLQDLGWIGNKPSDNFYASLLDEYRIQAEMKLEEISRRAKAENIPFRSFIKTGRLITVILKVAHLEQPDLIVITRRKHSKLSRLILGSLSNALRKKVSCPVKFIDANL
jgi:nucleotide-binding universal stress UspA family protein